MARIAPNISPNRRTRANISPQRSRIILVRGASNEELEIKIPKGITVPRPPDKMSMAVILVSIFMANVSNRH